MSSVTVSFISACTALVASILGPLVTIYVARSQIAANVLSVNRQKWIEHFRDLVASLVAQLAAAAGLLEGVDEAARRSFGHDRELLARVENLVLTVTKIRLMLNPLEQDHQNLFATMHAAVAVLRVPRPIDELEPEVEAYVESIVTQTQAILKREWIRVKQRR